MKACVMIMVRGEASGFDVIGEVCGRDGVVHEWDCDRGVIEATVNLNDLGALRKLGGVSYVRSVMCYRV